MSWLAKSGYYRDKPRLVLGDFNEIRSNEEKAGGPPKSEGSFANFRRMLNKSGLHVLRAVGGKTWKGHRLFRYDNRWRLNPEVKEVIQHMWDTYCRHIPGENINDTLKKYRASLSNWKSSTSTNTQRRIQQLQYTLHKAEGIEEITGGLQQKVDAEMNSFLTRSVTEDEITNALRHRSRDKSPGPDGFTAAFYKYHGSSIKAGVFQFVHAFFDEGKLDPAISYTFICLIPKHDNPCTVKDYRSISLCNVVYKIISKILAERLKPLLHHVISENQTALIPGRLVTDNVLVAHEVIHSLHTRNLSEPFMALKLDIKKWRSWIMTCLNTVSYSVLINSSPASRIYPKRGIRQDGSWIHSNSKAGVGWALFTASGSSLLQGLSTIDPFLPLWKRRLRL